MRLTPPTLIDRPRKAPRRPVQEAPRLELPLEGPERGLAPPAEAEPEEEPERGCAIIDFYV